MTAINTNTAALNAQFFMSKANKEMESAMTKLSSGKQVNSAADDAAGLAIASRMTSQLKGLGMAIKNAGDTVSLAQTAEGALEEVTNMLQRIRELAVQSANGTMNDSDRASLDAEVQALKTEIDRVASTTSFNNRSLLDGTFSANFQIGHEAGQIVSLKIGSVETSALGMGSGSSGSNTLVSGRIAAASAIAAGDIKINGQDLGAFATTDDMEDVLNNINTNVDNVTATGFNVVVAATKGDGVTSGNGASTESGNGLVITVTELGQTVATRHIISASSDMEELVSNINAETGGAVAASINSDGKLVLANNTGATITVEDDSASTGSGFSATETAYRGFIKLSSDDGNSIRVETSNDGLTSPGTAADVAKLGFNVTYKQNDSDAYSVRGTALSAPGTAFASGDLNINGVDIYDADLASDSFTGKLDLINSFSSETGVVASASFEQTFTINTDEIVEGDIYTLNGNQITIGSTTTVEGIKTLLDGIADELGLTATVNGNNLTLSGENVQSLTINNESATTKTSAMTSAADAASSTAATARVITIEDGDIEVGRTIELDIVSATATLDATVSYTIQTGDTATTVAQALADLLKNDAAATDYDDSSANGLTVATSGSDGTITIASGKSAGAATITVSRLDDNDLFRTGQTSGTATTTYASIQLDSVNNSPIKIDIGQNESDAAATHGFIEANVGAADFDVNEATLSAAGGSSVSGLSVATSSAAESALATLDNAINSINDIRGDLGAIQNRLEYTINNLSSISNATEGARGRIVDADYAEETSALTKQQILSQAATSMLAQANQSKQSVLALLQS